MKKNSPMRLFFDFKSIFLDMSDFVCYNDNENLLKGERLMRKKSLVLSVPIIFVVIFSFAFMDRSYSFTTERWLSNMDARHKMIEDIEKNHNLIGKTQKEVEELLGEPDNIWSLDSYDNSGYVYYIGTANVFSLMPEPDIYVISFENGVVIGTSVQPT